MHATRPHYYKLWDVTNLEHALPCRLKGYLINTKVRGKNGTLMNDKGTINEAA